jgi:hypothetical protein
MLCIVSFVRLRSKRCDSRIARVLLLSMLFTQMALAGSGCLAPPSELANILKHAQRSSCGMNANLCLVHCTAQCQTHDHDNFTVPVLLPATGAFIVVPRIEQPKIVAAAPQCPLPVATAPPIPILYCSFLI